MSLMLLPFPSPRMAGHLHSCDLFDLMYKKLHLLCLQMVDIVMNELLLWMMDGDLHGCLIRNFLKVYSEQTKSNL